MLYHFCRVLAYIPLNLIYPTKVIGKKNIPRKGKCILACNHRSNSDILVLGVKYFKRPYVLAKHTLFKNKLKGAIFKDFGAIPVDRQNVGVSSIRAGLKVLEKGKRLLLFPEGTRKDISDDEQVSLKNGTAMFAMKSNAPIVPMWLMKKPKAFSKNVLLIGKPFTLDEFQGQKLTKEILSKASEKISFEMQKLRDDYIQQQEQAKSKKQ